MERLRVYTYDQAADVLGVSAEWLKQQVRARTIAHARLGRNVRFTEEHLREFLDAATVKPIPAAAPIRRSTARSNIA